MLDRRRFLGAVVAVPLVAVAGSASAQAATSFRAIGVDTSPLLQYGGGGSAAALQRVLPGQMRKVFADLLTPADARAPTLVARIRYMSLTSYAGGYTVDAIGPNDTIEGDGIVMSGGREIASTHVLTTLSPSYSGAYYTEGIDAIRVDSLAYQFAYWLRREMNL
ncbi:hypothetical protein [Lichenihabitans psoromatis]|uniref:hypothetical protein n=1 Tax=Lichenihabitans psoromatis TaxID=2528642 RepID=UPI001038412E|nr:hypothetical protein [Lichenihabitans psoromatis]